MKKLNQATQVGIIAMIRADQDADGATKTRLIEVIRSSGEPPSAEKPQGPRVYTRKEAARLMGRSLRYIDALGVKGLVRRVQMPGNQRACGIVAADLEKLIESSARSL
jgi:hypothetical protein